MKEPSAVKTWEKTRLQNLVRHKSGRYYARLFLNGKEIWKALKTAHFSVAEARLASLQKEHRELRGKEIDPANAKMTFAQAATLHMHRIDNRVTIKRRTRQYWKDTLISLLKSWPKLAETEVKRITPAACRDWAEGYLRHMKAEHSRIEAKYRQRFGTTPKSYLSPYMDDAYFLQFGENWKLLAPKLGLESLAKKTGNLMRDAILGTRGNGTMLVEIFNHHQEQVYATMTSKPAAPSDFNVLQTELIKRLYLDQTTIHDENFKMPERDAVDFVSGIHGSFIRLFNALNAGLKPPDAERIKGFVMSICVDVGRMAQSELQAGIIETALDRQSTTKSTSAH